MFFISFLILNLGHNNVHLSFHIQRAKQTSESLQHFTSLCTQHKHFLSTHFYTHSLTFTCKVTNTKSCLTFTSTLTFTHRVTDPCLTLTGTSLWESIWFYSTEGTVCNVTHTNTHTHH